MSLPSKLTRPQTRPVIAVFLIALAAICCHQYVFSTHRFLSLILPSQRPNDVHPNAVVTPARQQPSQAHDKSQPHSAPDGAVDVARDHSTQQAPPVSVDSLPPANAASDHHPPPDKRTAKTSGANPPINSHENRRTNAGSDTPGTVNKTEAANCVSHVIFDKPMKTGSTAITQALKRLLKLQGFSESFAVCDRAGCRELAKSICGGGHEAIHLLQHIDGEDGLIECLRGKGYYTMTSIREPFERWVSAYLYNRKEKANHYGVSWTESYEVFMSQIPPCVLLSYYDGGDPRCRDDVDGRIARIVQRYDEIVDLYDEPKGQVERLIAPFSREVNKSPRNSDLEGYFDRSRLENETKLYWALKKRREELIASPTQVLCSKPKS